MLKSKFKILSISFIVFLTSLTLFNYFTVNKTVAQEWNELEGLTKKDYDKVSNQEFKFSTFREIAAKSKPCIVNVNTKITQEYDDYHSNFPFRYFFDSPNNNKFRNHKKKYQVEGRGSGVIIDSKGYIITNYHVIDKADNINITTISGQKYKAKIIGKDEYTDLALLKIDPKEKLTSLTFGDSDHLEVGDWVLAIGNPFTFSNSVSAGIVSAKNRNIQEFASPYLNLIQTDAAVNKGSSGGALLNINGELIGITQSISSTAGGFDGISFAVPSNTAKRIIDQLFKKGQVSRGYIGIYPGKVTPEIAEALGMEKPTGAIVNKVIPNSPADKAGLKPQDVILKFNGKIIKNFQDIYFVVASTPFDKEIDLEIIRDGKNKKLKLKVVERGKDSLESFSNDETSLGLSIQDINKNIAKSIGLSIDEKGVIVTQVEENSPAYNSNIRVNDIILSIQNKKINSVDDFEEAVKMIKKNKPVLLRIYRNGNYLFLTITLD